MQTKESIENAIGEIYELTAQNCVFTERNGFVFASVDGKESVRVFLSRAFPHDMPKNFISVTDEDKNELGIIKDIGIFDKATEDMLLRELERRYFIPKILEITSLEEKFGNSYWCIETNAGKKTITVKDTFKSIIRIGDDRAVVSDIDGNRYEIPSLAKLSKKSYRRIELFL